MILWPLSREHQRRLEDALISKFGADHMIELIDDTNAGYIAYSETSHNKKTKTVINVYEPFLITLIIEQYLDSFVEHEYLHVTGAGNHPISSLNPPEMTPDNLWEIVRETLTEHMLDIVKCANVILQQKHSKNYIEFECKKFEYLHKKYGNLTLKATRMMTLGYLDALCRNYDVKYNAQEKEMFDIYDLSIKQSAKEIIDELILMRKDDNDVNLFDLCVKLDLNIRQQKNLF